jgi:hypothetical protein
MPRAVAQLAGLYQPADRHFQCPVLLAGELQLLGDHSRLNRLIFFAQDVGQNDRLQFASRLGSLLYNRLIGRLVCCNLVVGELFFVFFFQWIKIHVTQSIRF